MLLLSRRQRKALQADVLDQSTVKLDLVLLKALAGKLPQSTGKHALVMAINGQGFPLAGHPKYNGMHGYYADMMFGWMAGATYNSAAAARIAGAFAFYLLIKELLTVTDDPAEVASIEEMAQIQYEWADAYFPEHDASVFMNPVAESVAGKLKE